MRATFHSFRAREELVPAGEERTTTIHPHRVFALGPRRQHARLPSRDERRDVVVEQYPRTRLHVVDSLQSREQFLDSRGIGGIGASCGLGRDLRPFQQVDGDVLCRIDPLAHVATPRCEAVDPRLDREEVSLVAVDLESTFPAMAMAGREHRRLGPFAVRSGPIEHRGRDHVVTVLENRSAHIDDIADRTFHVISTAVDLRLHVFDLDRVDLRFGRYLRGRAGHGVPFGAMNCLPLAPCFPRAHRGACMRDRGHRNDSAVRISDGRLLRAARESRSQARRSLARRGKRARRYRRDGSTRLIARRRRRPTRGPSSTRTRRPAQHPRHASRR